MKILKAPWFLFVFTFAVMIPVMYWAPYTSDDCIFSALTFASFQERLTYCIQYGNGRLFGNLLVLYLLPHVWLRTIVKSLFVAGAVYCLVKLTKHLSGHDKGVHGSVFLLVLGMPSVMFAQVFTWTSGFCNYVPPVFFLLWILNTYVEYTADSRWYYRIYACLVCMILGFSQQLFSEVNTVANIMVAIFLVVYAAIYSRHRLIPAILYTLASLAGSAFMYAIPNHLANSLLWETYQKMNIGSLKEMISSIEYNSFKISSLFAGCVLVFIVLSVVLLFSMKTIRKEKIGNLSPTLVRKLLVVCEGIFYFYPAFCIYLFCINDSPWFSKVYFLQYLFTFAITFLYFIAALFVCLNLPDNKVKGVTSVALIASVFFASPLLLVNPIGQRCIFLSYLCLVMAAVALFSYILDVKQVEAKKVFRPLSVLCLAAAMGIQILFLNIHGLVRDRDTYIDAMIENNAKTIVVPEFPYNYIHAQGQSKTYQKVRFEHINIRHWYKYHYNKWKAETAVPKQSIPEK